jgi:tRNA-dihydrouridine synthase
MIEETGAKEIMVGQGAMGNPWLFKRISEYINNGVELPPPSNEELMRVLAEHFQLSMQFQQQIRDNYPEELWPSGDPEQSAVSCFKRFMFHYVRGMRGVTDLRRQMNEYKTIADVMKAVNQCLNI